jgi:hypothetical protein
MNVTSKPSAYNSQIVGAWTATLVGDTSALTALSMAAVDVERLVGLTDVWDMSVSPGGTPEADTNTGRRYKLCAPCSLLVANGAFESANLSLRTLRTVMCIHLVLCAST